MVAKKTSDKRPSQRNGKKKPIEVRVWIHFKFVLDQPRSFSQPTAVMRALEVSLAFLSHTRSILEGS